MVTTQTPETEKMIGEPSEDEPETVHVHFIFKMLKLTSERSG